MGAYGFVDLCAEFVSNLKICRGKPAADADGLEIVVETLGEGVVVGREGEEAGVELDGRVAPFLCWCCCL